jgi:hypothetical protein
MPQDWNALTRLTAGQPFEIERIRLVDQDIAIEGRFTPPALAILAAEDQVFVAAFVRSHGSIKQMEQLFGVSYPTIKNRLNRIATALPFVDVQPGDDEPDMSVGAVLDRLERGEVSATEAVSQLSSKRSRKESSHE